MLSLCSLCSLTHFDCSINNNPIKTMTTLALIYAIQLCLGLPQWLSGKESTCQCRRHRFNPQVMKITWRNKWQPSIFAWEIPWTEEPGRLHSMGSQRVRQESATKQELQLCLQGIDKQDHQMAPFTHDFLFFHQSVCHSHCQYDLTMRF